MQFPRSALLWLLLSVSSVYIPLQMHIPLWTSLVFIIAISWRWMMHLGRWPYPTTIVKVIVVVLGIASVIISAKGKFHLESATTFILVASLLKVLEIKTKRDGYIVLFLSFFLLAVNFLYDQGLLTALYSVMAIWLLVASLVGLHQTLFNENQFKQQAKQSALVSVKVLALSLPIMLVLFILFPRIGPLWALNLQSGKAKTGLSNTMSPGDIADLSNSDELVFRVEFNGETPTPDTWYWRALVLDQYDVVDDRASWSVSGVFNQADWYPSSWRPETKPGVYEYKIIQEPNDEKWLVGLRGVAAMQAGIGMTDDDRLISKETLFQRKEYTVRSQPGLKLAKEGLYPLVKNQSTQIDLQDHPENNLKTRALADQIRRQYESDAERMNHALQYYRDKEFSYTLKPELMLEDDIDQFMFDYQAGFCAHFSSSFVFLMRSMGIPARVVAGYQGGELNSESGHITVRQYDAHAWAEVWLEGEGWVSVDPTAQVAPDRIRLGLQESLEDQTEFLEQDTISLIKFSNIALLNNIRLKLDQLNYHWHQTVLNFNKDRQGNILREWFGADFLTKSLYWLAGSFCAIFFATSLVVLWHRPKNQLTLLQKKLQKFDLKMQRFELQKLPAEGLRDYSQRLQKEIPELNKSIELLFTQLQSFYYSDNKGWSKDKQDAEEKELGKNLMLLAKKLTQQLSK